MIETRRPNENRKNSAPLSNRSLAPIGDLSGDIARAKT
jgi:hypothetical protein